MIPGIPLARISNGACVCHWCKWPGYETDARFGFIVDGQLLTDPFCSRHCAQREALAKGRGALLLEAA